MIFEEDDLKTFGKKQSKTMQAKGALIVTCDQYQQICFEFIKAQTPQPKIGVDWEFVSRSYTISRTKEVIPERWCEHMLLVVNNSALAELCRKLCYQTNSSSGAPHWFINGEEYWCIVSEGEKKELKEEKKEEKKEETQTCFVGTEVRGKHMQCSMWTRCDLHCMCHQPRPVQVCNLSSGSRKTCTYFPCVIKIATTSTPRQSAPSRAPASHQDSSRAPASHAAPSGGSHGGGGGGGHEGGGGSHGGGGDHH